MAAPKTQTLQQRFGFHDKDLTTPKHDEIMLWLDSNFLIVLNTIGLKNIIKFRQQKAIDSGIKSGIDKLAKSVPAIPLDYDLSTLKIKKEWEATIQDKSYVVGFVDFRAIIKFPIIAVVESLNASYYGDDRFQWSSTEDKIVFNFEVKSTIPSLGELFRQIQLYKAYDKNPFVIVCPDDRFKEQIESQGLTFLKYMNV